VVPILFDPSIDMVIAMLGIMKAGAAYCPLDTEAPEHRLRHIVGRVAARMVVGHPDYEARLPACIQPEVVFVSLGDMERAMAAASGREVPVRRPAAPRDPCYVLFTSGSTAAPKGCVLSHSAVANAVVETSVATRIDPSSRVLLFANYVFDASVADIFGCLCTGGTLCLSSRAKLLVDLQGVIERR
jgi:non-ribosomal peptide synthetase component F